MHISKNLENAFFSFFCLEWKLLYYHLPNRLSNHFQVAVAIIVIIIIIIIIIKFLMTPAGIVRGSVRPGLMTANIGCVAER